MSEKDENLTRYILDEASGKIFEVNEETRLDFWVAVTSILYLLLTLIFFLWLLFDVWFGQFSLATIIGYKELGRLDSSPAFHLLAYTIIGGALGGIVNGIRSILVWHSERKAFGVRFVWKYITAPWLGATLALFVYAIIRSGIAVLGSEADTNITATSISQSLATLSVGALAGYGSRQVFSWLDAQVSKLFKVTATNEVLMPDLMGKTRKEVERILKEAKLVGKELTEATDDAAAIDKVIGQKLPSGKTVETGETVEYTIAVKKA